MMVHIRSFTFHLNPTIKLHQTLKTLILKMSSISKPIAKRLVCPNCTKPARTCLCNRIKNPGLENPVHVTVLQHNLEKTHPLNSARILKLGLKNVTFVNVTDVIFEARFDIRLLDDPGIEPGSGSSSVCENVSESSWDIEPGSDSSNVCENVSESSWDIEPGSGSSTVCENVSERFNDECGLMNGMQNGVSSLRICNEVPAFTASFGKHCFDPSLNRYRVPQISKHHHRDFDHLLALPEVVESLSKGFVVKKMQKRKINNGSISMELEEFEEFELEIPSGSVLLFPSDEAFDVEGIKASNFKVKNLIVLDGTWSKAKRLYNENPWLKLLPHLKLDLNKASMYCEVRQQPRAGYLSTVESIVYTLKALGDKSEELDNLLDCFESMVVDQRRFKDERLGNVSPI